MTWAQDALHWYWITPPQLVIMTAIMMTATAFAGYLDRERIPS